MEELVKVCVDNGLGIASFIALLTFIFKYQDKNNKFLEKMSDTLVQMQINLATMTDRIDKIEEKMKDNKESEVI